MLKRSKRTKVELWDRFIKWLWALPILALCGGIYYIQPSPLAINYDHFPKISAPFEKAHLLKQQFTFLGEGAQAYAFLGEDGQTVLKLFKNRHMRSPKIMRCLRQLKISAEQTQTKANKWRAKFERTCENYARAFTDLREETALLALHFALTTYPELHTQLNFKGRKTLLNLNRLTFVLQQRITPLAQLSQKNAAMAESLKIFFKNRLAKGYVDSHLALGTNCGFIGNKPHQIDLGKLEKKRLSEEEQATEYVKIAAQIDNFFKQ